MSTTDIKEIARVAYIKLVYGDERWFDTVERFDPAELPTDEAKEKLKRTKVLIQEAWESYADLTSELESIFHKRR